MIPRKLRGRRERRVVAREMRLDEEEDLPDAEVPQRLGVERGGARAAELTRRFWCAQGMQRPDGLGHRDRAREDPCVADLS